MQTGDLRPQASGSASIGVVQTNRQPTDEMLPYISFHANSGVFHRAEGLQSGVLRLSRDTTNDIHFEFSKDGGKNFGLVLLDNSLTISSFANREVYFANVVDNEPILDSARSFTFDKRAITTVGVSGVLDMRTMGSPTPNTSGIATIYATDVANFPGLDLRGSGIFQQNITNFLQSKFFNQVKFWVSTNNATALSVYGNSVTSAGTVSHAGVSAESGRLAVVTSAAGAGSTAGTGSNATLFARGGLSGLNTGFFFTATVAFTDSSYTSLRAFIGMTSDSLATMIASDNPTGSHVGFQYSTARGDSAWRFMSRDGSTQNLITTSIPFSQNILYRMSFYCPPFPNNGVIYWEIENVSFGRVDRGTCTSNLPALNTLMRPGLQINNISANARSISFLSLYAENIL